MHDDDGRPAAPRHKLAAALIAAIPLALLVWVSQAFPAAHMDPQLVFSVVIWLVALGAVGVDMAMHSRNPERTSRVLALAVALRYVGRTPPGGGEPTVRGAMHRGCGAVAAASWLSVALVHALTAAGAWHFYGLNFRLFSIFGLAAAARATVFRVVGPEAALTDAAESSAEAAVRIAREYDRHPPMQRHQPHAIKRHTAR